MDYNRITKDLDATLSQAEKVIMKRLAPVNNLISDIKSQIAHGTDCITTAQLQEWALVIPIMSQELTPSKEAYALMKNLWDIEIKQAGAKNLLELTQKKTEIEQINRVAGTEGERKKAISDYMRNMLAGTQDTLYNLGNAVRKILDARIMNREAK